MTQPIIIPDLGDFDDVEVIEVHVAPGDTIAVDDSLITLETDKATMDVPAEAAGVVESLAVSVGDKVSGGSVIGQLAPASAGADEGTARRADETAGSETEASPAKTEQGAAAGRAAQRGAASAEAGEGTGGAAPAAGDADVDLVVIGSGPGGYAAAFRAADLGLNVALIERYPRLGGVCLNVGCIPSKALLHAAKVIEDAAAMAEHGIDFGRPTIDAAALRGWKDGVVERLTGGLGTMAKQRKVRVIRGTARFESAHALGIELGDGGSESVTFRHCIIAAGSESIALPGTPDDPRIVDSTGALELAPLPASLLVIGGGIIGLEMACVYDALGVEVTVVELTDGLMPGTDADLVRPLQRRLNKRYKAILLGTRVSGMTANDDGIEVSFEGEAAPGPTRYERVLVAVGRRPNGNEIAAERAGVTVDERGFVPSDRFMRTNVAHIYSIGDIAGGPMLAHKATHEGHVAAEIVAGQKRAFDARVIPSVAYTDPEVAWVGLTETEAKEQSIDYGVGKFPWAASGRSLAIGRDEGFTKLLFNAKTERLLGAGIVGTNAGDVISELALAVEMGADAVDIARTIHPHPTLGETVGLAAEVYEGTVTDLYVGGKRRRPAS
ncbi:MAG: dihydrolipoyl dehydrogenase [Pseudomonadota bacterium]